MIGKTRDKFAEELGMFVGVEANKDVVLIRFEVLAQRVEGDRDVLTAVIVWIVCFNGNGSRRADNFFEVRVCFDFDNRYVGSCFVVFGKIEDDE